MKTLNSAPINVMARFLLQKGIDQFMISSHTGAPVASTPEIDPVIKLFTGSKKWDNHEAVFVKVDKSTECIYIIAIHKSKRGRPEGGVRFKFYDSFTDAVDDVLGLSVGMTYKNAIAGIWEGGGKSVILPYTIEQFDLLQLDAAKDKASVGHLRRQMIRDFSRFVSSLQGIYLAGKDVNMGSTDMALMLEDCVHVSCLDEAQGGSGNPSPYTAAGVFMAIKAACDKEFAVQDSLMGRKILVKGAGQVGFALIEKLVEAGARVVLFEPFIKTTEAVRSAFAESVELCNDYGTFITMEADVFSPNATSGTLDRVTAEKLNCKIICGAENDQLAHSSVAEVLHNRGITYIPEVWVNYLGVFSASQEHRGIVMADFKEKIDSIYSETRLLLQRSESIGVSPFKYAMIVAQLKADETNPSDGHRGIKIISELFMKNHPRVCTPKK